MEYRFDSYKVNFFIVISLLALDCVLCSAASGMLPSRRQREEELSEKSITFSEGSLSFFGPVSRGISPDPDLAKHFDEICSIVGNKSFDLPDNCHAREFYDQLLQNQSEQILSDFCQTAGIDRDVLSAEVRNLMDKFPENQTDPKDITCFIKKFFSDHGYGHVLITIKQNNNPICSATSVSCKKVTILPVFFTLSSSSQQAILHKDLQHLIHSDCFYKHTMDQIAQRSRNYIRLQNILKQYEQFFIRRADLKAGMSGGDDVVDNLAQESYFAVNAPVNYMKEYRRSTLDQEERSSVIKAWIDACELSNVPDKKMVRTQEFLFDDSSDDLLDDAESFNREVRAQEFSPDRSLRQDWLDNFY